MIHKLILIADDDPGLTKALSIRCKGLGVDVRTSPDGLHAYQTMVQQAPDLLILDVNMPGAGGLYMCEELARDERFAPIPVIILTGKSDQATIERCKQLGAHYAWKGLETWEALKPMICELLHIDAEPGTEQTGQQPAVRPEAPETAEPCVLVIDDDPDIGRAFNIRLKEQGIRVLRALAGMQGYWMALKERPQVIITDYRMPDVYGNHVIWKLREHPLTKDTPLFVLTGRKIEGRPDHALERQLLTLGATRYFTKPPDFDAILRELQPLVRKATTYAPGSNPP